jgi:hypothetical protein
MNRANFLRGLILSLSIMVSASFAVADTVYWTDWTDTTTPSPGVIGTLTIGANIVGVSSLGEYSFAQTNGGTNYWSPSAPYLSATVDNAPPASDIILLVNASTITITFTQPVKDPLLALVSWNSVITEFGVPIEFLSYGAGYWGNGTPILNEAGTGFGGVGDMHGLIKLPGTYTSFSFTHTSENWHGFTVGAVGLDEPPTNVPEPTTAVLLGVGLIGLVARMKGFRK